VSRPLIRACSCEALTLIESREHSGEQPAPLNALEFIWDVLEHDFQAGLAQLTSYKTEHGHVRVPDRFKTQDGYRLGSWVSSRRKEYKKGTLTPKRIDALNALGFICG